MNDKLAKIKTTTALADPYAPNDFAEAMTFADAVAKSRMFGITSKEQALIIMAAGHELGLSTIQSFRGIKVIDGNPAPSADLLVAVVMSSGFAEYFHEVSTDDQQSTWETKRKGEPRKTQTYTMKDAERAKLIKPNGGWDKHPQRMLKARAKAFLARDVYTDILFGMYAQEEILNAPFDPREIVIEPETMQQTPVQDVTPTPAANAQEADDIIAEIGKAREADLPTYADHIRHYYPKGHPDRERLAAAMSARKAEVSRAA